ncbi:MAG: signal peptidase I, partial [Akkermansiaceae bacterium]|nr:signal peptidase I [Akkermansiaceae bacterium]
RTWVDIAAEQDDVVLRHEIVEKTHFKFFTKTYIPLESGKVYSIPGTLSKVQELLSPAVFRSPAVKKGEVIARGYVETGDQVIVDKFTYHWIRPKRGEVFVFTTNNIPGIQSTIDARMGSQHYIKRLAGTPGDHLRVEEPNLYINGEIAKEPGFQRVMAGEGYYRGYSDQGIHRDVRLGPEDYFALGDNSFNSSDSRYWGRVPAENIVGRALFVYMPFGNHWGPIH